MTDHPRLRRGAIAALCCLAPSLIAVQPAAADFGVIDGFDIGDVPSEHDIDVPLFDDPPPFEPSESTFVVDSVTDANDANPGDGVCEAELDSDQRCTLRAAVEEANAASDRPFVWAPDLGAGYKLELGALVIERPMTIRGIEGPFVANDGNDRVFDIASGSSAFTDIMDLTVLDGESTSAGGNILVRDGSRVRLLGLTIIEGSAITGAGVGVIGDSTVIIEDSEILWNRTQRLGAPRGSYGGGLAADDYSDVVIRRSTIAGNVATYGGGLMSTDGSSLTVYDSTIEGNEAHYYGGGVAVVQEGAASFVRTQIVENAAALSDEPNRLTNRLRAGGGLYVGTLFVSIEATTISGNTAMDPRERSNSPDCHTVLTTGVDYLLTLVGAANEIGDFGDSCEVVFR